MATIRRRNNKWQIQIRIRDYGASSKTFINKKDALQWGREKEIELQRSVIKYKRHKFPVTKELIKKYIDNISIKKEVMNLKSILLIGLMIVFWIITFEINQRISMGVLSAQIEVIAKKHY